MSYEYRASKNVTYRKGGRRTHTFATPLHLSSWVVRAPGNPEPALRNARITECNPFILLPIILSACASRPPTREECLGLAGPVDATIKTQLSELTRHLTTGGEWTNGSAALPIYNSIQRRSSGEVTNALVYNVCYPEGRSRLLYLISAVKLGMAQSEQRLNALLMRYGDQSMAEDYLNSGSDALDAGGRQWASAHGFRISTGAGSHRARWGSF